MDARPEQANLQQASSSLRPLLQWEWVRLTPEQIYWVVFFLLCLGVHLVYALVGWNNTLLDLHGFRQTQTAITSYYVLQQGFKLDYWTPVLGAPWSIPMEFPIYQWIVALVVKIVKTPLDQTGRFVNLMFFYLSLLPLYGVLGHLVADKFRRLLFLGLVLLTPTYIFWSRTFMLESTALFFSLAFLCYFIWALKRGGIWDFVLSAGFGSLAGLTKITTWIVFVGCAFLFYLWRLQQEGKLSLRLIRRYLIAGIILVGIPMLISLAWVHYSDHVKNLNPMVRNALTSKALRAWNFGTWAQRLDYPSWERVLENSNIASKVFRTTTLGNWKINHMLLLVALFLILGKPRRLEISLSFLCFLMGPLIFMNLYFVHIYYFYANAIFLSVCLGFMVLSLLEMNRSRLRLITQAILLPGLLVLLFSGYWHEFHAVQTKGDFDVLQVLFDAVKHNAKPSDVVFIDGCGWDSSLPYYFERKVLMNLALKPTSDERLSEAISNTGVQNIAALVVNENDAHLQQNMAIVRENLASLNFDPRPVFQAYGFSLYVRQPPSYKPGSPLGRSTD